MYVCMYICMYVYLIESRSIGVLVRLEVDGLMAAIYVQYVCMYVCLYVCIYVCMFVFMYCILRVYIL